MMVWPGVFRFPTDTDRAYRSECALIVDRELFPNAPYFVATPAIALIPMERDKTVSHRGVLIPAELPSFKNETLELVKLVLRYMFGKMKRASWQTSLVYIDKTLSYLQSLAVLDLKQYARFWEPVFMFVPESIRTEYVSAPLYRINHNGYYELYELLSAVRDKQYAKLLKSGKFEEVLAVRKMEKVLLGGEE